MPGHLETLLAFDRQYQRDQQQSPVFLHRRDRRYALDSGEGQAPDISRWLAQLHAIGSHTADRPDFPEIHFWHRFSTGFIVAGALLGVMTMSGLLFYDGGQQINVTAILGFVLLQLMLALYTAVQGLAGWQPWSPLIHSLQQRLQKQQPSPALSPLMGPMMARTAQAAGLAFGLTALITLLISVVFQDLAFGWSTTLDTSAGAWHRVVSWVAVPWSGWLPVASPSLELVEETRFFRLEGTGAETASARWGAWWPFVAMAWLVWVILPRAILLAVGSADLRRKSRHALTRHPGYQALLWRMETPAVDTGANTSDSGRLPDDHCSAAVPVPQSALAVSWAGATADGLLPGADTAVPRAGGNQSLQADRETLARLSEQRTSAHRQLVVVTRSWEPPTAELADFLEDASEQLPGLTITLLPVAAEPGVRPDEQKLGQWLRFAERVGQGVRVAAAESQEAAHDIQ
ncbi:DUF2868 domain-containing protein [Marinobacter sp.]|uniref:DUF2868 domain-containing protein n=1 Tax=Marinobacter sp. TaxID=50741 RepID=UPI0035640A36